MSRNYSDNYNKEFVVSSQGQNPNQFQVKLPHNCVITPNTEIALTKGRFHLVDRKTIDNTNNTFVLLWGQYNMDITSTVGGGTEESKYLPPEVIQLKPGTWDLKDTGNFTAGLSTGLGFGNPNILNNLVDSLNEQSRYFCWQWGGEYTTNDEIAIFPYWANHSSGACDWINASFSEESIALTVTAAVPATSPETITISDVGDGASLAVTNSRAPFPYTMEALPNGNVVNPRELHKFTLPVTALPNVQKIFGGFITEQQITYRQNESYNSSKDWIGLDPDNLTDLNNAINNCIFGWEVRDDGLIGFFRREILEDGKPGDKIEEFITATVYDGSVEQRIGLRMIMSLNANVSEIKLGCSINGVSAGNFTLDAEVFKYSWRHAVCNASDVDLEFIGICESAFIKNRSDQTLGPIPQPTAAPGKENNIRVALVFAPMPVDSQIVIFPDVRVNQEFSSLTKQTNALTFLQPNALRVYNYINTVTADAGNPDNINLNLNDVDHPDFHVCIENLPIENALCNGSFGQAQKRIYSQYNESGDLSETIEPFNLYYHKLAHKQPFVLDTFKIRITDNENRTSSEFAGTTILNIHIRSNPHRTYQSLIGTINDLAQRLDTIDNTEQIQQISNAVF